MFVETKVAEHTTEEAMNKIENKIRPMDMREISESLAVHGNEFSDEDTQRAGGGSAEVALVPTIDRPEETSARRYVLARLEGARKINDEI